MKCLRVVFLGVLACVVSWAQARVDVERAREAGERAERMRIGYSDGNMALGLGLQIDVIVRGAIQFPPEYMQRLKGNKVTSLRLALAGDLTMQENYVFLSTDLSVEPFYKQSVEHLGKGWNDIKLDVPYEITGDELFIGFKYRSAGDVLSMDGRADNDAANWIQFSQQEDARQEQWSHQSGGSFNLQAFVEGANLPQNDVRVESVLSTQYAQAGGATPVRFLVRNMAAREINDLEVTCEVDGQKPVTRIIEELSVASDEIAEISFGDVEREEEGIYDLRLRVEKVNGEEDEAPADNEAVVRNIIAKKDYVRRKVLLEHFSTMLCNNCPSAHKTIGDALTHRPDVIHVIHHAGLGTDPLTIPAHTDYLFFYTDGVSGSVYAPGAMMDRTNLAAYGADDGTTSSPGPAFFPQRATFGKLVDQCLSVPALVSLDIDHAYNAEKRTLSLAVAGAVASGDPERLKGDDIRLNIFLVEDSILGTQLGAEDPNAYYHNDVVREVLTDTWGDPIRFEAGAFQSDRYEFVLPKEWRSERMRVVAFLANSDRTDPNNCRVYNAEEIALEVGTGLPEREVCEPEPRIKIGREGDWLHIYGQYDSAMLYDVAGLPVRVVSEYAERISIGSLPYGIYFLQVRAGGDMRTLKFVYR